MSPRLSLAVAFLCVLTSSSQANPTNLDHGIGVVVGQSGMDRVATIVPGIPATVRIVTDDLGSDTLSDLSAVQFGVDIDPRLEVLASFANPDAFFTSNPDPDDWLVAFLDCVPRSQSPVTLVTYLVNLPQGSNDTDLRIDVRNLTSGEPILFTPCSAPELLRRLYDAGGVLLNPSNPSVVHVSGSPSVLVEGRPFELAWESFGGTTYELDGLPVAPAGKSLPNPLIDTTYQLVVTEGGSIATGDFTVEVIREPRVEFFFAEYFDTGTQQKIRLSWDVRGSNNLTVNGEPVVPYGFMVVPIEDPLSWNLLATNEWGSTSAATTLEPVEGPPTIAFFNVSPGTFVQGDPVTLSYNVVNADAVSISPDLGSVDPIADNLVVFPAGTTTYTLTATNAFGSATAAVTTELRGPTISSFFASPANIFEGASTTLNYATFAATTLEITPDVGFVPGPNGDVVVTPTANNTTYTLTASNAEESVTATVTISWKAPDATLTVDDTEPFGNQPIVLTATIAGATSATLEPVFGNIAPNGGNFSTTVIDPTTFTLTAINSIGSTVRTVTVTPQAPVVTLVASNPNPNAGELFDLVATVQGADSATLEPGFGNIDPGGGIFQTSVATETTFTLTATNPAGSSSATITVSPPAPEVQLTASDPTPFGGETVELTATISGATTASIDPDIGPIDPNGGVFPVVVNVPTTYVLTAVAGPAVATDQVTIVPRAPQASLAVSPSAPFPQETVTFTVNIAGATSATLEPGFGSIDPAGGEFTTMVPVSTTFTLTASNPTGDTVKQVTINPRPPIITLFEADPATILVGESSTLSWQTSWSESVTVEPIGINSIASSGFVQVSPTETTTYTLTATNSAGSTSAQFTVVVEESFFINLFTITPSTIFQGQSATLNWEVVGTASVTIGGLGTVALSGSTLVTPNSSRTYLLTATDGINTRTASTSITVLTEAAPTIHLSSDPTDPGRSLIPIPFVPAEFYILSENTFGFIDAFECSFNNPDPFNIFVTFVEILPRGINIGEVTGDRHNIIAGLGECVVTPLSTLARITVIFTDQFFEQGPIELDFATPSSFNPPTPGYQTCGGELIPFQIGTPMYLNTFVGVANLPLRAQFSTGTVELEWDTEELPATDQGRVLRATMIGEFREIARLSAAEVAAGSFVDDDPPAGSTVRYKLVVESNGSWVESSEAVVETTLVPGVLSTRLKRNVPNPFNPSTEIRFELAESSDVILRIYDVTGRLVRSISRSDHHAGAGSFTWNGMDEHGRAVASGAYVVQLITQHAVDARRITLLK